MTVAADSGYSEISPPPELRGLVRCFWLRRESSSVAGTLPQRVLPDNCADWVFDLSATLVGAGDGEDSAAPSVRAFAVGPMTRPLVVQPRAGSILFGVRFAPGRWRRLFGGEADAMRDRRCDLTVLDEEAAPVGARLLERLLEACDNRELSQTLARAATTELRPAVRRAGSEPIVERALGILDRHAGTMRIEALAKRLGCTRQHLANRFRREVGLTPKTYGAVLRFQSALADGRYGAAAGWADVAQRHGYSDQSHLLRDFRRFAGAPPSRLAR